MPKCDPAIYGTDDTGFADKISGDALIPVAGGAGANMSDYWGDTIDDAAKAKGNTDAREEKTVNIIRKQKAGTSDGEALDDSTKGGQRHRRSEGSWGDK